MFSPWGMGELPLAWPAYPDQAPAAPGGMPMQTIPGVPTGPLPLRATPAGAFPVPESISPEHLPASAKEALLRVIEGPPKPVVTHAVMDEAQATMIAPDLPTRGDV